MVGKSHKTIPRLMPICECLKSIIERADNINMVNYAGHAAQIKLLAQTIQGNVDILAMEDAK